MLTQDIAKLKGVGSSTQELLRRLGIKTVKDLVLHTPFRYEDFSNVSQIKDLQPGPVTLRGNFKNIISRRGRRGGLHITQAILDDGTGGVEVTWFNQPYRAKTLNSTNEFYVSGEFKFSGDRFSIVNPSAEKASAFNKNTARIRGVYPETKGLRSATIRRLVYEAIKVGLDWDEDLPAKLLKEFDLLPMVQAVRAIHFPDSSEQLRQAKDRFKFNEVFELILAAELIRQDLVKFEANKIKNDEQELKEFVGRLGFTLTDAQRRASWEIIQDIDSTIPMNRLLQGDVGSGKTAVAAMAMHVVAQNGGQAALVAPTEIVAGQHAKTLKKLLDVRVKLLTSSTPARSKSQIKRELSEGTLQVLVGTHAVLQPDVNFKQIDLLVIDEQHRFGVNQRSQLAHKDKVVPHVLTMTATPIPRTLALTIYSDLTVSNLDELPAGRKKIDTKVYSPAKRSYVYEQLQAELDKGHQAYVVCPLIEESEKMELASVQAEYKRITKAFPKASIAKLHGSLKPDEKDSIVNSFKKGQIDILVSTTVVEVGVDVPNATFMLIEGAERFGLAQLHQLRGRVGRSDQQAFCVALTTNSNMGRKRLAAFESTTDGFELAELDLQLRGGGHLLGTLQSGAISFKHASLTDAGLINLAKQSVKKFLTEENLLHYPKLLERVEQYKSIKRLN